MNLMRKAINFRLMKIQRIIYNSETSLKYFTTNVFTILNYNFVDLKLAVPEHEKKDFYMNEEIFTNMDLYSRVYVVGLQEIMKELPADFPKAQQRYFYVFWASKFVHATFFYLAFRTLNEFVLNFIK